MLVYLLALAIGAVAALWVAKDARRRGRNPWLWGLLTLVGVFVVVPLYLYMTRTAGMDDRA